MNFGAMAAWQAGLLIASAAGVATGLFLLKLRPPRVLVASLLIWRRVLDQPREVTLWERIRRAVSLVLTILIAVALALAAVRPSPTAGATAATSGRVLIVLDSSWSMLARTGSGETRWERGVAEARRLAAGSGGDVILATTANGLVEGPTRDLALIDTTLDRLTPTGGEDTVWPRGAGSDAEHFITDGTLARPLAAGVIVHSVFERAPNVAITAFDVRAPVAPDPIATAERKTSDAGVAYLEIANFADTPQSVRVTLTRGTTSLLDRRVEMAAGESLRQVVPLARGSESSLRAHVEAAQDALPADDEAFAWIAHAQPLDVTIVGERTEWLRTLFGHDASVSARFVAPSVYAAGDTRGPAPDVLIFDRWAPASPPTRPTLCFAPPPDTPWLYDAGQGATPPGLADEKRPHWETAGSHPVVRGVDPLTMTIERVREYRSADLLPVARSARGTTLVYVSRPSSARQGQRIAVVAFGPGDSNLASAPGFPVLVGNALEWLTQIAPGAARRPGLMTFDATVAAVTGPRGLDVALTRVNRGPDETVSVGVLTVPGLYVALGGGARSTIPVNVGDPHLSNLGQTTLGPSSGVRTVTGGASAHPWWIYCALAAFALALGEWWTWQRRITV